MGIKIVNTNSLKVITDIPENYLNVTYELSPHNGETILTITQENCASEEVRTHSESNWMMVMNGMKELVEKNS